MTRFRVNTYYIYFNYKYKISVTGISGTFYSVNYPSENYTDNYEEHYIINVEDGSRVNLVFEHFDIEYHVSCIYDNIEGIWII